jgi:multiple sugar transport system substrate-binding protein
LKQHTWKRRSRVGVLGLVLTTVAACDNGPAATNTPVAAPTTAATTAPTTAPTTAATGPTSTAVPVAGTDTPLVQASATSAPVAGGATATLSYADAEATRDIGEHATETAEAASRPHVEGGITFQVYGEPTESQPFGQLVDTYMGANPGAGVNINHVPAIGEYMTKLSASITAGNPPDVFLIDNRHYAQFVGKGVIANVTDHNAAGGVVRTEKMFPEALVPFSSNGKVDCAPINISGLTLYYNKDLFTKYNVGFPTKDWKWNDLLKAAQALTKDTNSDGKPDIYGIGIEPTTLRLAPFIYSNGGDLVDNPAKPTKLTLDTPAAREAIGFFTNLSLAYRVTPTEPESQGEGLELRWENGGLGMFLGVRADTANFRHYKAFDWDVAPVPGQKNSANIMQAEALCVAAGSKNAAAAWQFVEFATRERGQELLAATGRIIPTNTNVSQDAFFAHPTEPPMNNQMYIDMIPNLHNVPLVPGWPAVENAIDQQLEPAFFGSMSVDQAIQQAQDEGTAALQRTK